MLLKPCCSLSDNKENKLYFFLISEAGFHGVARLLLFGFGLRAEVSATREPHLHHHHHLSVVGQISVETRAKSQQTMAEKRL